MELSVGKLDASDISRNSRSLDLHSVVGEKQEGSSGNSRVDTGDLKSILESKDLKRKRRSTFEIRAAGRLELRRKRSRKEVSLSSFQPVIKRRRNGLGSSRLGLNGLISGAGKPEDLGVSTVASDNSYSLGFSSNCLDGDLSLSPSKKEIRALSATNSESSDGLHDNIVIPKRPRGTSRRKNVESLSKSDKAPGDSSHSDRSNGDGRTTKLSVNTVSTSQVLNDDQKRGKENIPGRASPDCSIKDENGSSTRPANRKVRITKRNELETPNERHGEKQTALANNDKKFYGGFQEDDEENLEQNAARMLSSRFDPRCTGFSESRMVSSSKRANRSLFLQSLRGSLRSSASESSSRDAAGRVLRPRRRNGRGFVRKRRHFYEVCSKDIDPYSILRQRIRVFWPLDKTWYFGLVKDYDPVSKLHHVKYDDRDEEWIDLQKERVKLLLFPSEVTSSFVSEKARSESTQKLNEGVRNATNSLGGFMDSEPIIRWLARSTRPLKSSHSNFTKKQKRVQLPNDLETSKFAGSEGHVALSPPMPLLTSCIVQDMSISGNCTQEPRVVNASLEDRKSPLVYSRKRFRNRNHGVEITSGQASICQTSNSPVDIACGTDWLAALDHGSEVGSSLGATSSFSSVTHGMRPQQESQLTSTAINWNCSVLKLNLPPCIDSLTSGAKSFWLWRALFLLHTGILMRVWPMVHMEIVFVDSVLGLKILSFEGCLEHAAILVCLILRIFCQHKGDRKLSDLQMPSTSIGFNLSCMHDRRCLRFVLYRFLEFEASKWRYLEDRLGPHLLKVREFPIAELATLNIKHLISRSSQILCTSILSDPVSLVGSQERSCADATNRFIPDLSTYVNVNPAICCFDDKNTRLPPHALSFAAAPLFLINFHLKLLMRNSVAQSNFQNTMSVLSRTCEENYDKSIGGGSCPIEDSSDQVSEITLENPGCYLRQAAPSSGSLALGHLKLEIDAFSASSDGNWMRSSHKLVDSDINVAGGSVDQIDTGKNRSNETDECQRFACSKESWTGAGKSSAAFPDDSSSPDKSEGGYNSFLDTAHGQSQHYSQMREGLLDKGTQDAQSGLIWEMNERVGNSPNATAPRSMWHRNRHNSVSPTFGHYSKLWPEDFGGNGFICRSRKPRSRVSYSLSLGGNDLRSKLRSHHRNERSYKKLQNDGTKWIPGGLGNSKSYLELLSCNANVLVMGGDKGWREFGAQVVLDSDDRKDWRLSVKLSGVTKYAHKVQQCLQPGVSNRYTHAMMWKGGKDWTLEFTDRGQWSLFKEMHEECYNRNIRAASVKNIPTPGVRLVDEGDENAVELPFLHGSSKYIRQVGTEVEMALDPSHVLYDMDSGDDEWISKFRCNVSQVTDDLFERMMDMFEKFAYAQQCDEFSDDEIEEIAADVGQSVLVKAIYEHWRQKRQKKGLPLIRQFQPPLWEIYQQQLKQWELAMSKCHILLDGCQDKACSVEKPPMFAFCLRPRGLEVPNKGSKQRSHKKFLFTGHHNAFMREQEGSHALDRKPNGFSSGEEKGLVVTIPNSESSDSFYSHQSPSGITPGSTARTGVLTPKHDPERSQHMILYRNNSRKSGMFTSPRDSQTMVFSHNQKSKKNGSNQWSTDMREYSRKQSEGDGFQRHRADIDEFRLRDASSAAHHASNMAKLKREKAQWLLHKADLAVHKATVALMIAEAIESSEKDSIGDG